MTKLWLLSTQSLLLGNKSLTQKKTETISFIDLNSGKTTHEWVLPAVSSSVVKCLLASDDSTYIVNGTSAGTFPCLLVLILHRRYLTH
jgi:hypothetical protein